MDTDRVSTDFSASFDSVIAPTQAPIPLGPISSSLSLPRGGDFPNADGNYYYEATKIDFNNETLAITSPGLVITLTDTSDSIDIGGGSGEITLSSGATLEI